MNAGESEFQTALIQELIINTNNWFGAENWDQERFGPYKFSFKGSALSTLNRLFSGKLAILPSNAWRGLVKNLSSLEHSLRGLGLVYDLLADAESKATLIKVLAYRLMGYRKVKLPINTSWYWSMREGTTSLIKSDDAIKVSFPSLSLQHMSLEKIGYPVELFLVPSGVMITFILKQYEYGKTNPTIKVRSGDYVIDAGGCWGDTALYFAHNVGSLGQVYSFEFTPENLDIFQRNLKLNPDLAKRIEIVPHALWEDSGRVIHYSPLGPGTSMAQPRPTPDNHAGSLQVTTLSIDDFINERKLPRVDFIKMDIEGAELKALKGAEKTLINYRPRLAISVYHRQDDLIDIPTYIKELDLGYEFFLDHFTIYGEETVLFAQPNNMLPEG